MLAVAFLAFGGSQSQASVVMNAEQVGGDVVISGGGTLNLDALTRTPWDPISMSPAIRPSRSEFFVGAAGFLDIYTGVFSGPSIIGSDITTAATSGTGSIFGLAIEGDNWLLVPQGYTSGSALLASALFAGQTFASLGLAVGTYVWSWGEGQNADSFTLNVGVAAVPVPAGLPLLAAGLGALGFAGWRKKRSAKTAVAVSA